MHKAHLLPGVLVTLRIVAALVLLFHPSFDEAHELDGWDVARFQEIADAEGQPYQDYEVEYPPGSLGVILAVTALENGPNRVVTTHRVIVVLSLLVDLGLALLIARACGRSASTTYLLLGAPMLFFGLVRFDLWAALLAVMAAVAMGYPDRPVRRRKPEKPDSPSNGSDLTAQDLLLDIAGAAAITAGALVKVWPAVLILGAFAIGRQRLATIAVAACSLGGMAWILISGSQAPEQVLSLRGATGWHSESIGGSLTALLTEHTSTLEANAYRIGAMNPAIVQLSRIAALAAMLGLAWLGSRSKAPDRFALITLGSLAALVVSAPLFSPQFLLWLTPWAALLSWPVEVGRKPTRCWPAAHPQSQAQSLVAGAIALTVLVHVVVGPGDLDRTVPALVLLARDGLLLALIVICGRALRCAAPSAGAEDALGSHRSSPWTTAAQTQVHQVT